MYRRRSTGGEGAPHLAQVTPSGSVAGPVIVNAVMVVVAVSLVITSIGTSRSAPRITVPTGEQRRPGEAILVPTADIPDDILARIIGLAGRLADPVGGILQPIVVIPSTAPDRIESGRSEQERADQTLRRMGQDVETQLRGDLQPHQHIALIADNLVPGRVPSISLGAQVARTLASKHHPLVVGPTSPEKISALDIQLPEHSEFRDGTDVISWVNTNTDPGDLIILPFVGNALRPVAEQIYDSGRSLLAVAQNPGSQSALGGSTMSLPIGGTVNP